MIAATAKIHREVSDAGLSRTGSLNRILELRQNLTGLVQVITACEGAQKQDLT